MELEIFVQIFYKESIFSLKKIHKFINNNSILKLDITRLIKNKLMG